MTLEEIILVTVQPRFAVSLSRHIQKLTSLNAESKCIRMTLYIIKLTNTTIYDVLGALNFSKRSKRVSLLVLLQALVTLCFSRKIK